MNAATAPEAIPVATSGETALTPERLEKMPNPAMVRLAVNLRERADEEDAVSYSRMHNRHNRG